MQFVTTYFAESPDHECIISKPLLGISRPPLHPYYHMYDLLAIPALTDPGDTINQYCTQFLRCTSSVIVDLRLLTPQQAYRNRLPKSYIDVVTTFTRNMYMIVFDDNHPPLSAVAPWKPHAMEYEEEVEG